MGRRAQLLGIALALVVVTRGDAQTTYYVRQDGGSASQCSGTVNAPYPGAGAGQPCAWNHPFQALPPGGSARITGGDTIIIATGSYRMGLNAPGAEACWPDGAYECTLLPIPSGSMGQPTRVLGAGWDTGCADPPELWGSERPWQILSLEGASHVEVACLEITDHSACIEDHCHGTDPCPGAASRCERDQPPYGDWAPVGLFASDSSEVVLRDINFHGLATGAILAGRLTDWTLERVRMVANGWYGWNGDIGGDSSNSGDLLFAEVEIGWNGCGETWPGGEPFGCWAQETGGYGDGLGTNSTLGRWVFEDCHVHDNTSDGLDLLYLDPGGTVEVRRLVATGNAGNPLKVSGSAIVENSFLMADCAAHAGFGLMLAGDLCRAAGNALAIDLHRGDQVTATNVTITGQGDCLIEVGCGDSYDSDPDCDGSESVTITNSVLIGATDFTQPNELSCLYWYDDSALPTDPTGADWNVVWRVKHDACPGANDICGQDPQLFSSDLGTFDGRPWPASPAVDSGLAVGGDVPDHDIDWWSRPYRTGTDRGAWEAGDLLGDCDCDDDLDGADVAAAAAAVFAAVVACPGADADCSGSFDAADMAVTIRALNALPDYRPCR